MKHRFLLYIIILITLMHSNILFSHPLDISFTSLTPRKYGFYCETYIHPFELELLLGEYKVSLNNTSVKTIKKYLFPYFKKRFRVYQGNKKLAIVQLNFKEENLSEILSQGIYLIYKIKRANDQPVYKFKINLFTEYFKTQTNKLILLTPEGKYSDFPEVILTGLHREWTCDVRQPDFSEHHDSGKDSDGDGLTDHMEKRYGYNPKKKDSDGDGFDDLKEFWSGSDPMNAKEKPEPSQDFF